MEFTQNDVCAGCGILQGSACCRCVQPASVQPRKTYNTLVTQLFPAEPIKTDDPIDSTMRRKIQKLQEYLQANPAKVPKVSAQHAGAYCWHRPAGLLRQPAVSMKGFCDMELWFGTRTRAHGMCK